MESRVLFDDLHVGQEFQTASYLVTAQSIKEYASQYDPQPMHLDEVAAAEGLFGQLTASGWQTLSLAMKLMVEAKPLGATNLLGVAVDDIRFLQPVYADTWLTVRALIIEKRESSKPGRGYAKMKLNILDASTETVVAVKTWTLLVPRLSEP